MHKQNRYTYWTVRYIDDTVQDCHMANMTRLQCHTFRASSLACGSTFGMVSHSNSSVNEGSCPGQFLNLENQNAGFMSIRHNCYLLCLCGYYYMDFVPLVNELELLDDVKRTKIKKIQSDIFKVRYRGLNCWVSGNFGILYWLSLIRDCWHWRPGSGVACDVPQSPLALKRSKLRWSLSCHQNPQVTHRHLFSLLTRVRRRIPNLGDDRSGGAGASPRLTCLWPRVGRTRPKNFV